MLNQIHTAIAGNLTADPELRFTQSGKPVATFTVAHTPRFQRDGEWTDGSTTFMRCDAWGPIAENVAESFSKGDRVTVLGTLRTDEWQDKDTGEKRTAIKLTVDEVGASVQYATVDIRKIKRNGGPDPVDPWTGEAATARTTPADAEAPF